MPEEDVFEDIEFEEPEQEDMVTSLIKAFTEFLKKGAYKYPGAHKYPYMYPGQKKKYPWQKLKKMGETDDQALERISNDLKAFSDLKASHDELTKSFEEAKKELDGFKSKQMEAKVNTLVEMQEGLGMVTDDNKEEVLKNFSSLSLTQVDAMIEASKKLQPVKQKSFKADEAGGGSSKKEIEAMETRIKDFQIAGLKTEELEEKLKKMKGEA